MKKYKIIFSDIDGTLLNDENQVPKETVEELQSLDKRGIPFVLVSARMPEGMRPIRKNWGFMRLWCATVADWYWERIMRKSTAV